MGVLDGSGSLDLEKAYMQGRFDAIPYIDKLAKAIERAKNLEEYKNPSSAVYRWIEAMG